MPGKKITDQQVRKYKAMRRQATQEIAAARMGISVRSARRIEKAATARNQLVDVAASVLRDQISCEEAHNGYETDERRRLFEGFWNHCLSQHRDDRARSEGKNCGSLRIGRTKKQIAQSC